MTAWAWGSCGALALCVLIVFATAWLFRWLDQREQARNGSRKDS